MYSELLNKIEGAFNNKVIGYTAFTDEEVNELYIYASHVIKAGLGTHDNKVDTRNAKTLFVALVEIAKTWKKDMADDDADDERGFWSFVYKALNVGPSAYRVCTNAIELLVDKNYILEAENVSKKYWATVLLHSFAPFKSICAFLDLCFDVYKDNLDFYYSSEYKYICEAFTARFCEILSSSVGKEKNLSLGASTYNVRIGLRTMALNELSRECFTEIVDQALIAIDNLYYKRTLDIDNYFTSIISKWWQTKLTASPLEKGTRKIAVVHERSIDVKFVLDDKQIKLAIPSIILNNDSSEVELNIYNGSCLRFSQALFTVKGALFTTSRQTLVDLNYLLLEGEGIDLRVSILINGEIVFDKFIKRDFILVDRVAEVGGQLLKSTNYYLFSTNIEMLSMPFEYSYLSKNLYNIYPSNGDILEGSAKKVLFDSNEKATKNERYLLYGQTDFCKCTLQKDYSVYGKNIAIIVGKDNSLSGLEIRIGAERFLLSSLRAEDLGNFYSFPIGSFLKEDTRTSLSLYSYKEERELISEEIVYIPSLRLMFNNKEYYENTERTLSIYYKNEKNTLSWLYETEIEFPLVDGTLLISIPYLYWRIDGQQWRNESFGDIVWYKDYFSQGSLLELKTRQLGELCAIFSDVIQEVPINRAGMYEIGKVLWENCDEKEIRFIFAPESDEFELFSVATKEYFRKVPLVYKSKKMIWSPDFVGDKSRKFFLRVSKNGETVLEKSDLGLEEASVGSLARNYYQTTIISKNNGVFNNDTGTCFINNSTYWGREEEIKYKNKVLWIEMISDAWDINSPDFNDTWQYLLKGYGLSDIKFINRDDDSFFTATLFVKNGKERSKVTYLNNGNGGKDRINPVIIRFVKNDVLEILAGYTPSNPDEYLGQLIFNKRTKEICNYSGAGSLYYSCINYYRIREDRNV